MTSTVPNLTAASLLNYDANDHITTDAAEQYDSAGNTTATGAVTNVYDFENKLVRRGTVAITYDGDGNRVAKTAPMSRHFLGTCKRPNKARFSLDVIRQLF